MQGYVPAQDGAFAESRKCFGELEDWMALAGTAGLQHGELEEQLEARGRELLHSHGLRNTDRRTDTVRAGYDTVMTAGEPAG